MTRPRLLDLFCGAGGAAMGYHRAGFDVVGVDLAPQLRYPFKFVQADAMDVLEVLASQPCPVSSPKGQSGMQSRPADRAGPLHGTRYQWLDGFDAIHASPPCQVFAGTYQDHSHHPDLLTPARELLKATGLPYVIENIATAPMPDSFLLCGATFDLPLIRHRRFEVRPDLGLVPSLCPQKSHRRGVQHKGRYAYGRKTWEPNWRKYVLPVVWPWMTVEESGQAIPPAYTEYIGARLLEHLAEAAA